MSKKEEKKNKKGKGKKEKKGKGLMLIPLVIVMIVVVIAASFFSILYAIVEIITEVVGAIVDFLTDPVGTIKEFGRKLGNAWNRAWGNAHYSPPDPDSLTIILSEEHVENLKAALSGDVKNDDGTTKVYGDDEYNTTGGIDLESAGLTDFQLKKIILTGYMTMCTIDTEIAIPITLEEMEEYNIEENNFDEGANIFDSNGKLLNGPFYCFIGGFGDNPGEKGQIYLATYGCVELYASDSEDYSTSQTLSFYKPETLEKIKKEMGKKDSSYSEAVKRVVERSYQIDEIGTIKMTGYLEEEEYVNSFHDPDKEIDQLTFRMSAKCILNETDTITQTFNYMEKIGQFTSPMELLVDFLELTGSDEFVDAFSDTVFDSKIKLVINANKTETIETETLEYNRDYILTGEKEEIIIDIEDGIKTEKVPYEKSSAGHKVVEMHQYINVSTEFTLSVLSVDSWYCKSKRQVEQIEETENEYFQEEIEDSQLEVTNTEDKKSLEFMIVGLEADYITNENIIIKDYNKLEKYDTTIITQSTNEGVEEFEDNTDKFLSLLKNDTGKYSRDAEYKEEGKVIEYSDIYDSDSLRIGDLLVEGAESLFELLASSENTEDLEDVMKYILYRYTNNDYGITDFEQLLSLFNKDDFNNIHGSDILYDYMRICENTTLYESYINKRSSSKYTDGTYYLVYYGGEKDNTYNLAYGLVISRNYNDSLFSKYGVDSGTLRSYNKDGQQFTSLTPDIIEKIFEEKVEEYRQDVISILKDANIEVEQYQIDALTAIKYQYGNIGNFEAAYINYYKNGDIEGFIKNFSVTSGKYYPLDYNTQRNKENRTGGRVLANYKLFAEGIYAFNGYTLDVSSYLGGIGNPVVVEGVEIDTYTNSSGRTFILYNQNVGPWASKPYSGKTIGSIGCNVTSLAVISSGYGHNYTPARWSNKKVSTKKEVKKLVDKNTKTVIKYIKGSKCYGQNEYINKNVKQIDKNAIIDCLKNKGIVLFHVIGSKNKFKGCNIRASSQHWMTLLDISQDGSQVFISGVRANRTGWDDIDTALTSLCCYCLIYD